jgi:NADH-quinone oxidoreductase subunit L
VFFLTHAWLIFTLPAVSFALILLFGKRLPRQGDFIGIAAVGLSFLMSCAAAVQWIRLSPTGEGEEAIRHAVDNTLFTWFSLGGHKTDFGTHVDGLTVMMYFLVTLVSLMVHIYSTSYMHGDRRYVHFFAALSLFTASMLEMVSAPTTLQILLGWEGMGLCSFLLIGHWWEEQANSDAALKAFFTTRTGDIGLLVGISTLYFANGQSFNIASLNAAALSGDLKHSFLVWGALALFIGVIGKSAQFPLHTWLPDAMAGPTPVSALIHAATMVVAGVYLVARCYGVFWSAFSITHSGLNPIAVIGAITIIIAALLAFVQDDIKKVLAYSTVSQLGYMVLALGVGSWTGGIFHLFTHAFFKACLFLGAGSVSHSVHSFDMKKDMGGMRKFMPTTFWTFVIASIALAGIFPFAGFWSKDEILLGAGKNGYMFFMIVGLVGAFMTAAYMGRCIWLTFFGEFRGHGHPHESPKAITVPLIILAFLSVTAGWLAAAPFGIHAFGHWTMNETFIEAHVPEHPFNYLAAGISLLIALSGAAIGFLFYEKHLLGNLHELSERNGAARWGKKVLVNKYYLDDLYTGGVVDGIKGPIAQGAYWVNQNVIDAIVNAFGIGARHVGQFTYEYIDQKFVDGVVNGTGVVSEETGAGLRVFQTGRVQNYAAFLFGALVVIGAALVAFT